MKQKILIGSILSVLILSAYIWYSVINILNESTNLSDSNNQLEQLNENSWTPLMQAAWDGDLDKASSLIDDGANVNMSDDSGNTPLHLAVQEGNFSIVRLLIESGASASLNDHTDDNKTPLYLAAEFGYMDIFTYLVESGAKIEKDLKNNFNKFTMLHTAVRNFNFDMVNHLLELGFDPNAKDKYGQTPIMLLYGFLDTTSEDLIKMISILVNGGADVNAIDSNGVSCLILAYNEGKEEVIDYLIQLGALDVIETKADAQNALQKLKIDSEDEYRRAIIFGNLGAVKLYLKAGYDPNIRDEVAGSTMLLQLVYPEDLIMMELLIRNGANPNIKNDAYGITPLWAAVSQNKPNVVELLLKYGAKNIANDAGWTPLKIAKDDGKTQILNLFEKYSSIDFEESESSTFQSNSEKGTDFYYGSPNISDENTSSTISESPSYEEFPEFQVLHNNEVINRLHTLEEAIAFAKDYENVEVWYPNVTKWDNKPSRVYQNNQLVGDYDTKVEALEVAGSLENAKVVNLLTGKVEWDSYPRECGTCESAIKDEY